MKKTEQDMLNAMSESERRVWLMERYWSTHCMMARLDAYAAEIFC
jgi:hypothetical protein